MTATELESPAARATHELLRQFAHLVTDDVYAAMKLALEMAYTRGQLDAGRQTAAEFLAEMGWREAAA